MAKARFTVKIQVGNGAEKIALQTNNIAFAYGYAERLMMFRRVKAWVERNKIGE